MGDIVIYVDRLINELTIGYTVGQHQSTIYAQAAQVISILGALKKVPLKSPASCRTSGCPSGQTRSPLQS